MTGSEGGLSSVKRELKELQLLVEISQILDRSMDLREVVGPVLEALARHMEMLRGTLALVNRETGEIVIDAAHGLSESQKEKGRYRPGEGVTGKVIQTGKPAVVPRVSQEPQFLNRTGARSGLRKKDIAFICVPIKIGNEVLGALSADRLLPKEVSLDEDLRVMQIIGSMIAQAVRLRQSAQEEKRKLVAENQRLQEELKDKFRPANIIGNSKQMQDVYDQIAQVCRSQTTVLIRGESGTGKELVAHAIHYNSDRSGKPFIRVNCAALPETLVESELFGHEKGAFTGALTARQGRFELANGGTIFLDEVGDFSPATQVKLLRVLQ
ncbi:MAG: sigma 54-interacting transcriptional regulator, partial [Planctomycetaceae bacterium]|nr:sigma 54-interacting transcriptional regulator [Planctomycetaceae bacterium]